MISWSLSNIFQFSFLAPSLMAFFLFMASIFNQDMKGFVYLAGALFATCLNRVAQSIIQTPPTNDRPAACSIFDGFPLDLVQLYPPTFHKQYVYWLQPPILYFRCITTIK